MKADAHSVAVAAVVGALYAVATLALAPISYGPLQLRLSECLCVLPFFLPCSVWGLAVGCALANIATGSVLDIVFGSLATLIAGLLTARAGRLGSTPAARVLGCAAPVAVNALVVGAVVSYAYNGFDPVTAPGVYALNALQIAAGEAAVMFLVGLPLMHYLPGKRFFREIIEKTSNKEE